METRHCCLLAAMIGLMAVPSLAIAAEESPSVASDAINALGVELLAKEARQGNVLLSPYSIQSALVMTYVGATGKTREEMQSTLHYPDNDAALHGSFVTLQAALTAITMEASANNADSAAAPPILVVANRLFGQNDFQFRSAFLEFLDKTYRAPLQRMDFSRHGDESRRQINAWVLDQTRNRIVDLIPKGGIDDTTRLVLVNAIYLKAAWLYQFDQEATRPRPFMLATGGAVNVPTMQRSGSFGYEKREGCSILNVPYVGEQLQLLILVPDDARGLPGLQDTLNPRELRRVAALPVHDVVLSLPQFKIEPPVMTLSTRLREMGMPTAFDEPPGSAHFELMASTEPPGGRLWVSEVYHKTFLTLDESGTEAAAATAVVMATENMAAQPIEVKIDRPFIFAIQHRSSGACLFIGRVNDPRVP